MSILDDYDPGDDLRKLAETDYEAAKLKRGVEAADYVAKKYWNIEFLAATGNVEERKAQAGISQAHDISKLKYFDALEASEKIQNERRTLQLRIDVWRSLNANRRQG